MSKKEEVWWGAIMLSLIYVTAYIGEAVIGHQPPKVEKTWCRDKFGTERPLEFCDD